ncbi:hypothetical protein T4E_4246 [Trichinella pseudospiralis]|uniref:Uncharacterized protein n=1 Tax=Trichinella pseudospiralis TaxID=6337 RepID=A0A0V0YKX0_TRIPS|nr:hypothetical protein T4E_4246 [Trichinella pseudospiralis]
MPPPPQPQPQHPPLSRCRDILGGSSFSSTTVTTSSTSTSSTVSSNILRVPMKQPNPTLPVAVINMYTEDRRPERLNVRPNPASPSSSSSHPCQAHRTPTPSRFVKAYAQQQHQHQQQHQLWLMGLHAKTLHTLYAGSFLVYLLNLIADWVHTFHACRGLTVTFPLKSWCAVVMVCSCVVGSTLNFLLVHLCCEHALRPARLNISTGSENACFCRPLCVYFKRWLFSFDCFRISFLIMLLEDLPLTIINYVWLSGCIVPNPAQPCWPLAFAALSTLLSLGWRFIMVGFSFKRLQISNWHCRRQRRRLVHCNHCAPSPTKPQANSAHLSVNTTTTTTTTTTTLTADSVQTVERNSDMMDSLLVAIDLGAESNSTSAGQLHGSAMSNCKELDFLWPIRVTSSMFRSQEALVQFRRLTKSNNNIVVDRSTLATEVESSNSPTPATSATPTISIRIGQLAWLTTRQCCCFIVCLLLYVFTVLIGCAPCIHHYYKSVEPAQQSRTVRRLVSACTTVHQTALLGFSLTTLASLFVLNVLWLQSILLLGTDRSTVTHVAQLCVRVDPTEQTIEPILASAHHLTALQTLNRDQNMSKTTPPYWECKPIFDDQPPPPEGTVGASRRWMLKKPHAWILVKHHDNSQRLTIWTDVEVGSTADRTTIIWYDVMLNNGSQCTTNAKEVGRSWRVLTDVHLSADQWPLWHACHCTYAVKNAQELSCVT